MQHPDMAKHAALFPVYRYIDMLFEDHLLQIPQNAAQAVAETEQIVSHLHAEPVVPAHGEHGLSLIHICTTC